MIGHGERREAVLPGFSQAGTPYSSIYDDQFVTNNVSNVKNP
jgi:hypothetical protein